MRMIFNFRFALRILVACQSLAGISSNGQLDPAHAALLGQLNPEQRAEALQRLRGGGAVPSDPEPAATPDPAVRERAVQTPAAASFDDRGDYLSRLSDMEVLVRRDLLKLEDEASAAELPESELIEALSETRALLRKIKELQRREIEKRAEEFAAGEESALKPFGYDLFAGAPTTFAPGNEAPVPPEYVIGPGDVVEVQLFGRKNAEYALRISREGLLRFPEVGPVNVFEKGTDFLSLKNLIKEKVGEHLGDGVRASVHLGALRSIRVFLLGEVHRPGAYVVSSLSTMTNALLVSGGIKEIGSLRNVQLKRRGEVVARLDLYDLLLDGDTSADARLKPGDVIFVPTVGPRASVGGSVLRPARYELKGGEGLGDLIALAGGLAPRGYGNRVRLERLGPAGRPVVRNLKLSETEDFPVAGGDLVSVPMASTRVVNVVSLVGGVERAGDYEWTEGMRLGDLIPDAESLRPKADREYGLIRREGAVGRVELRQFRPRDLFTSPDAGENPTLAPRDVVMFFDRADEQGRRKLIRPLLDEQRGQSSPGRGIGIVTVGGLVHFPGEYPLTIGMRITDLLAAAGGMTDAAYALGAELTRMNVAGRTKAEVEHLPVESLGALDANASGNLALRPYDVLNVKSIPEWRERESVEILGEVRFPGTYVIRSEETLAEVVERAGGLTERAFTEGAVFTRIKLKEKEDEQRARLVSRLEADVASLALQTKKTDETLKAEGVAASLLARLRASEAVGRLVLDLSGQLEGTSEQNLQAENGDRLYVPKIPHEVSVVGEVQFPTSHLHEQRLGVLDYVKRSGGFTSKADEDKVFTVRANGAVVTKRGSGWFARGGRGALRPGDVVVVPIDLKHGRVLENMANATQIIYQLAVAAAAVNSF